MSYSSIPRENAPSHVLPLPYAPKAGLVQNFIFLQVKKSIAIAVVVLVSSKSPKSLESTLHGLLILATSILPFWTPITWKPRLAPHKFTAVVFYICWLLQLAVQFVCLDLKPQNQLSKVLQISALNVVSGLLANQIKYSQAYFVKRLYPADQQVRVTKYAFLYAFMYPQILESILVAVYLNTSVLPDWTLEVFRAMVYLYFAVDLFVGYPVHKEVGSVEWNDESLYDFYKLELASVWKGVLFYYYFFLQFL